MGLGAERETLRQWEEERVETMGEGQGWIGKRNKHAAQLPRAQEREKGETVATHSSLISQNSYLKSSIYYNISAHSYTFLVCVEKNI